MDLAPYIRELVLLNECVILPSFGGFETHYTAAKYDNFKRQMLPPTKHIQFRQDYIKGGGVLEDHLCKRLRITNEQAVQEIEEYVTSLKVQLEKDNEVIIAGVGLFAKGLGGMLNFTPFEEENYLVDSFGLEALPYEQKEVVTENKPEREFKMRARNNTMQFVIIGFAVILVLLIVTVFVSSKFDLYLFNLGDKNASDDLIIIGNQHIADTTYRKIDNTLTESTDLKTALYYAEERTDEVEADPIIYYLVAGSFKTSKNAENTQKELIEDGYLPSVIENQGFYRVTIGSYSDKQEALNELQRLRRQLDRSIWLLQVDNV